MKRQNSILSLVLLTISFYSCSSSQQQTQEAITNEDTKDTAIAPEEGDDAYSENEEISEPTYDDMSSDPANSAFINNSASSNEFATTDTSAMTNAAFPASDPNAVPSNEMPNMGGSVLYTALPQIYGYQSPAEGATPTCTLDKGDHPLLQKAGDWGQIKADQHVKLLDMSEPAIARERTPLSWQ